jgi:hypothetical protein
LDGVLLKGIQFNAVGFADQLVVTSR